MKQNLWVVVNLPGGIGWPYVEYHPTRESAERRAVDAIEKGARSSIHIAKIVASARPTATLEEAEK